MCASSIERQTCLDLESMTANQANGAFEDISAKQKSTNIQDMSFDQEARR